MKLKRLLLPLSTLTLIAPVATVISCSSSSSDEVDGLKYSTSPRTVETLEILETPEKDNVWNAEASTSINDAMIQMDQMMHIFFPKKLSDMTPFEFAKWLVDIYNNNGSGKMNMTINYKGQSDVVKVDFKQPMLDVINTFKDAHISEETPRAILSTPAEYQAQVVRMVPDQGNAMMAALSLALQAKGYDGDLFLTGEGINGLTDKLKILSGENVVANAMFPLIAPFPDSTLHAFIKILDIFHAMSEGFKNSPVATQWAKDNNIEQEFNKIDHEMIRIIMKRAV